MELKASIPHATSTEGTSESITWSWKSKLEKGGNTYYYAIQNPLHGVESHLLALAHAPISSDSRIHYMELKDTHIKLAFLF